MQQEELMWSNRGKKMHQREEKNAKMKRKNYGQTTHFSLLLIWQLGAVTAVISELL